MTTPQLNLEMLGKKVRLSSARCEVFVEACKVCLEDQKHQPGVALRVDGFSPCTFNLIWQSPLPAKTVNSWDDPEEATENGACAIAFLVVLEISHLSVIRRARKRTGFDYWLAPKDDELLKESARLEISGIRKGTVTTIEYRVQQKKKQTQQSDHQLADLPAYIVIVEFSNPVSYVEVRHVRSQQPS